MIPLRALLVLFSLCFFSKAAFAQGETERFDIKNFEIVGSTLLTAAEIQVAVQPFTGTKREYGDVQQALEALEFVYRSKGYSAVQVFVPEQELDRGIVRLQVIESRLGVIKFEGNRFFDDANVRRSLPALRPGTSPNASAIAANVQLANENPAKQVDVVLRVSDEEGIIDADVTVNESKPVKLSMTLDNTGTDSTGNYRLGVGYQNANLFNRDHVISANYITAPEKSNKVSVYSLSYRLPLYGLGDSMDLILAKSDTNAGSSPTVAGPLQFSGRGNIYGLRYNQLFKRRGEYSHRLVYGLDQKEFDNTCSLGTFGAAGCGSAAADVTVRPASLTYSGNWQRPGAVNDFFVGYSQNLPGVSNGKPENFAASRPGGNGAPADYKIVRFGGSMTHAYKSDWQSRVAFSAQITGDSLVAGEQFGIAGSTAVRGFLEREIARDAGWFSNFELTTPNMSKRLGMAEGSTLRGLIFYDFGAAAMNQLPNENGKQRATIASAGVGLRWSFEKNLNVRFDLGRVMRADIMRPLDSGPIRHVGDFRGHISIYHGF